jgi:deoxycytidine triphosphate deaminase
MYSSAQDLREIKDHGVKTIDKSGKVSRKSIIENTTEDQWNFIEGSAFNLKLAEVRLPDMSIKGEDAGSFIGVKERSTPPTISVPPYPFSWKGSEYIGWVLEPGSWALLVSEEITNAPLYGFMPVKGRFTFASAFSAMTCSDAQPNYQGRITTVLKVGPLPLRLEQGCDFCFVRLAYLTDDQSDAYQGVWGVEGFGSTTQGKNTRAK